MKIKTFIHSKPVKNKNTTFIGSEESVVRVDKIRRNGRFYEARLSHKDEDAPYEYHNWLGFNKSKNRELKIPVIQVGQELNV